MTTPVSNQKKITVNHNGRNKLKKTEEAIYQQSGFC